MNKIEDLKVWRKAMDLAVKTYEITKQFPDDERYNLTSQMRRSAVSISSNIAEGAGRNFEKQFLQFLSNASGSSYELLTQFEIAKRIKLIDERVANDVIDDIQEIQKMSFGLQSSIRKKLKQNN